jgi:hypothetical protein
MLLSLILKLLQQRMDQMRSSFFCLENVGELRIIALREEKRPK